MNQPSSPPDNQASNAIVELNLDQAQAAAALAECLQLLQDLQVNLLSSRDQQRLSLRLRARISFAILQLEPHVSSADARAFAAADSVRATSLLRTLDQLQGSASLQA